jgi:hypothetical protein
LPPRGAHQTRAGAGAYPVRRGRTVRTRPPHAGPLGRGPGPAVASPPAHLRPDACRPGSAQVIRGRRRQHGGGMRPDSRSSPRLKSMCPTTVFVVDRLIQVAPHRCSAAAAGCPAPSQVVAWAAWPRNRRRCCRPGQLG